MQYRNALIDRKTGTQQIYLCSEEMHSIDRKQGIFMQ